MAAAAEVANVRKLVGGGDDLSHLCMAIVSGEEKRKSYGD